MRETGKGVLYLSLAILGLPVSLEAEVQVATEEQKARAITATHALGEVISLAPDHGQLVLKTAAGEIAVQFSDNAQFLLVPPGETTLEKATPVTVDDVHVGDRVLARGKVEDDRRRMTARQIVVMTKAAIDEKQARERDDWRRRGVSGTVTAIDAAKRELNLRVSTFAGPQALTLAAGNEANFRRYATDSVKWADALPSSFDEIKVGDQVRALGQRDDSASRVEAEIVVFGTFVMSGGPITAVDVDRGTITIRDLATKGPVTITVNQESLLRRIPAEFAAMLARRAQMMQGQAASGGQAPALQARRPDQRDSTPGSGQRGQPGGLPGARTEPGAGSGPGTGPSGGGGGGRVTGMRGGGDLSEMFGRLPAITLNELTVGEVILVSSTQGSDPSRVTAIQLAAGVEPLLTESTSGFQGDLTFPSGVFDMGMSMP
jgi:hypothetical protein